MLLARLKAQKLFNAAATIQSYCRGYLESNHIKNKLHRSIVDHYVTHFKNIKIAEHTRLQVLLKYVFKKYKIKKKKKADRKKALAAKKKKKGKKKPKKVDPMDKMVRDTGEG